MKYQQFWLRAAKGSNSLINFLVATGQLRRGNLILAEILDAYPESKGIAAELALPLLKSSQNLRASFAQSMVGELQYISSFLLRLSMQVEPNSLPLGNRFIDVLGLSTYQPNASLNFLRKIHEWNLKQSGLKLTGFDFSVAAQSNPCANPNYFVNPVGKILACMAEPEYKRYLDKVITLEQQSKILTQRLVP